jgi:hypothetical protein
MTKWMGPDPVAEFRAGTAGQKFRTALADPPWQFINRTGKVAPEHPLIEGCSPGPYLELFARGARPGWSVWGMQAVEAYGPTWKTYAHNSASERRALAASEAE